MDFFYPALVSFLLALVGILLALKIFPLLGILDNPQKYNLSRKPIPYSGGIVILLVFLISVSLFLDIREKHLLSILIGATLISLVGFIDDLKNISPGIRLFCQVLAALIIITGGIGITTVSNPLGGVLHLDSWQIKSQIANYPFSISVIADLFTIFWVIFCINAMNFIDGVPGLASGISTIAGTTLLGLYLLRPELFEDPNQNNFAILCMIFTVIAAAFLIFDFHPPKILMGDSGSTLLGFILASLSIFSGAKIATAFLVFGIPIFDAFFVILRRIKNKKSPLKGDLGHFHHRLLKLGLSERQSLVLIYAITILFGLSACIFSSFGKMMAILLLFFLLLVLEIFLAYRLPDEEFEKKL